MMRENRDIKSVKDLILENEALQARIDFLQQENNRLLKEHRDLSEKTTFQNRQINALKFRNADYRRELDRVTSMGMFEFADKYCSDSQMESDARLFAKELLHSRVTGEYKDNEKAAVIAEEEFINHCEALYEATWNINCGDDF